MTSLDPSVTSTPLKLPFWLRLRVAVMGLVMDFWKEPPKVHAPKPVAKKPAKKQKADKADDFSAALSPDVAPVREPKVWTADRVDILERIWGEGHALPGGNAYLTSLSSPLGITSEMSILDLSAGLGDMARLLAETYGTYVTGMEMDPALAAKGMVISIAAGKSKMAAVGIYDPATYTASRKYDCVFARELFYRVIGKEKFFKAIDSSVKSGGGQVVFTDYILDPSAREKPAIGRWLEREKSAAPMTSIETIKTWKGMGYDLRVAEDQTEEYRAMIVQGLKDFVEFMVMHRPDEATKPLVVREVDLWVRRMEAFSHGLKYYRFFGIKH